MPALGSDENTGEFQMPLDKNGRPKPRQVTFHLKDWGILVTILSFLFVVAGFVLGLMFYPKEDGEKLRGDFNAHVSEQKFLVEDVKDVEDEQKSLKKTLRRIEIRQIEMAPRRVRDRLPDVPDEDDSD